MANHIYPLAKKQMLLGGIDLSSVNVKALLVNVSGAGTLYTYSAAHEFLSDIPSGGAHRDLGEPVRQGDRRRRQLRLR